MHEALATLVGGGRLTESESASVFESILGGEADPAAIGALLGLMASRPVSADELVGAARVMRRHVTPVPTAGLPAGTVLVDTCGTGGAPKTFNISTAAALLAAGAGERAGVRVAKHGNRSRTGRGSAEVLAALGVNVNASPEVQARCLSEAGVCFCFAIHHHPAMKHAAGPRRALGFPTVFNLLGPLTNPAGASRQLLGVWDGAHVGLMAEALRRLGSERALVVHGRDGLDEITTTAATSVAGVEPGGVREDEIDPSCLGLGLASLESLRAADVEGSAAMIRGVLAGEGGAASDIACLNAGAALLVGGAAGSLGEGLAMAREAAADGRGARALARLASASGAGSGGGG